ncbi:unnamed protein product, partial [marine sediment metagenome]
MRRSALVASRTPTPAGSFSALPTRCPSSLTTTSPGTNTGLAAETPWAGEAGAAIAARRAGSESAAIVIARR